MTLGTYKVGERFYATANGYRLRGRAGGVRWFTTLAKAQAAIDEYAKGLAPQEAS